MALVRRRTNAVASRDNQVYISDTKKTFYCYPCERYFDTFKGLQTHCENSRLHTGAWCNRCEWLFISSSALQAHLNNSSRHNFCDQCDLDFKTHEDLHDHDVSKHLKCPVCYKFVNDIEEHEIEAHNKCVECGDFFSSRYRLEQVWTYPTHTHFDLM